MESTFESKIWNITPVQWEKAKENDMSKRFYRVLLRWIFYAKEEFSEWETRPNSGYFFGGNFWYSSETASTALIFAVAAKLGDYDEKLTGINREKVKEMAVKSIRYMGFTHDTGPPDCVRVIGPNKYTSEKKWGGKGDNFFMASQNGRSIASYAMAAWLLWDDLDLETKEMVQMVVENYADKFCEMEPRNGSYYDTQCEENAWTSAGIGTAMSLFPEHPNHEKWKNGFENWSINTVTTYWDRLGSRSGLIDGLTKSDIKTINFHPDYTTENHAFVHPSYLCAGINLRAVHAVFSLMGGKTIEPCALFNNVTLYEKTVKIWVQHDGLAIPIQGQDWWYNRHHERQLTHSVLNVLHKDVDAARLERNCLEIIEDIQESNSKGCLLEEENHTFNVNHSQSSKDFEPGSALDLVNSYLLHAFGGIGTEPVDDSEFKELKTGVYSYPHGCFVIHRTPDTFTSFSWRNNVMFLNLPKDGLWNVTPLFNSYTGLIRFKGSKENRGLLNEEVIRRTNKHSLKEYPDGFAVSATIDRGDGTVEQKVAVVSLPDGHSVYMEKMIFKESCDLEEAYTGVIGIRNENYKEMPHLAPGERTIYLAGEQYTFKGFIGSEPNQEVSFGKVESLNVDNKIGYLLKGTNGVIYKNQHQYSKWKGIEDLLILNDIGKANVEKSVLPIFSVITMPNQTAIETHEEAKTIHYLSCHQGDVQVLTKRNYLIYTNFNTQTESVKAKRQINEKSVDLFEGSNEIHQGSYIWKKELQGEQSGFYKGRWKLKSEQSGYQRLHIEAQIAGEKVTLLNHSKEEIELTLVHKESQTEHTKKISGLSFEMIENE
ncbi:hypothetical protein [Bacillus sp. Marseille-Q3570]|uniref:hypothetical protein n=1 Tax=Bacillus sp. Marseille-Q3570 TaxID=2963522 RepID=UPI0021B838D8|nr:hypothetical protein [Bacillus sp. Marseille-Q3570]